MKFCTKCGAHLDDNTKFCNKCGSKLVSDEKKIDDTLTDIKTIKTDILKDNIKEYKYDVDSEFEKSNEILESEDKNNNEIQSDYEIDEQRNQRIISNNYKNKKKNIFIKIFIGIFIVIIILIGIFFNKIRGTYYMMKCRDSYIGQEKLNYAIKAVSSLENDESKELLKDTIINMSQNNLSEAETKLEEISNMLTESDYRNLSVKIKEMKIKDLCGSSKYEEAFNEFDALDKLGEDFRKNEYYDDIMLNVAAKVTGTSYVNSKDGLMEKNKVAYDNFGNDNFDEIIQIKDGVNRNSSEVKIILYKYVDGRYKQVDTNILDNSNKSEIQGVYKYSDTRKGIYVGYYNFIESNESTSVFSVEDEKLSKKGTVGGKNITRPEDINNDGIYEIKSTTISNIVSNGKEITKWYVIHEDGSMPTEVNDSSDENKSTSSSESDYIFANSDKEYLTEEDLNSLSKEQLALARNEIYARHGYVFKEEPYKSYFSKKNWYVSNSGYDGSDSTLNQYEIANYKAIQSWENR